MNRTWWSGLLLVALSSTVMAAAPEATREYRLDNGMQVIVKTDRRSPVAITQVWYGVGGSYEPAGLTGISHVLEHMMFKGTASTEPGEFSRTVSALGGSENAFTGRDYTGYYVSSASEHLDRILALEADRMRNLRLSPDEFAKELRVVQEERRLRVDDKPRGLLREQFNAVAWRAAPYANPIIGWMSDLEGLELADLQRWYEQWYAPNNATVVVVGDVDPDAVHAMAKRHFGGFPAVAIGAPEGSVEPPQHGVTRVVVQAPARQPYLMMGYKTPNIGTAAEPWEPYALTVLAAILDGGQSARLNRELVRGTAIAASAGASYDLYSRLPGLLQLSGVPTDGVSVAELEQGLREQIARLRTELVSAEELQRVVAQVVADEVFEKDSMFYQAMEIGLLETVGLDWRLGDSTVASIRAVTAEQIRTVAERYLTDNRLTIGVLEPEPAQPAARAVALPVAEENHDA